ncbi:MAG: hypothetical protein ABJN40_08785 [Sneathiella sp.]
MRNEFFQLGPNGGRIKWLFLIVSIALFFYSPYADAGRLSPGGSATPASSGQKTPAAKQQKAQKNQKLKEAKQKEKTAKKEVKALKKELKILQKQEDKLLNRKSRIRADGTIITLAARNSDAWKDLNRKIEVKRKELTAAQDKHIGAKNERAKLKGTFWHGLKSSPETRARNEKLKRQRAEANFHFEKPSPAFKERPFASGSPEPKNFGTYTLKSYLAAKEVNRR